MIPPPPAPHATIDFETYSEAGYVWNDSVGRWQRLSGAREYGIRAVGADVYARHPSTEILVLAYRMPGQSTRRWVPGMPLPFDLFAWIASGGLVEAHNVMFERLIWHFVAVAKLGWPPVPVTSWRCSMATARTQGLPGALDALGEVLRLDVQKDADGKRLIKLLCVPRQPTLRDKRRRTLPAEVPDEAERLYAYCERDVDTEHAASARMVPMSPDELAFWQIDQEINWRGVAIDLPAVRTLAGIVDDVLVRYGSNCQAITNGVKPSQIKELTAWLRTMGVFTDSLDADAIEELLKQDLPAAARAVLEIRQTTSSASVKKLQAMLREVCDDGRLRGLYSHHGARTGRPTGNSVQPTNLPKAGPDLKWDSSGRPCGAHCSHSPWTGESLDHVKPKPWDVAAVDFVVWCAATSGLDGVEAVFGDPLLAVSGCVRGMFVAGDGADMLASDYTAIEAVVAAGLAGEQWRLDVFRAGRDIYLESISRITGTPYDVYRKYREETGQHHPDRQDGKIAELASGYGGWVNAWRNFGASGTDDEIKRQILGWRNASPNIVEFWGGQGRGFPGGYNYRAERYGLEGAFVNAIQLPGHVFEYRGIKCYMRGDAAIMRLLSGRELTYQQPRLSPSHRREGEYTITYWTWNTNPKYGAGGWVMMDTYGGRLFENLDQAIAHDIQRFGITNLWRRGYPVVLHVYDENVVEIPRGFGTIEELESIMSTMPDYARTWPIKAAGGWRGRRYRKG